MENMAENKEKPGNSFITKLATFIVDKRNLFFLLTIIMLIFSEFSWNWVQVESDLAAYLPEDSGTRQALDVMEEQFTTFGSAADILGNASSLLEQAAQTEEGAGEQGQGAAEEMRQAAQDLQNAVTSVQACQDHLRSALEKKNLVKK